MLAKLFICIAVVEVSLAHPQVSVRYFEGENAKVVPARSPRLENPNTQREPRIDTNCEGILTPSNPDCCFMIDANHERTKPFGQPLEKSPFKINLVAAGNRQLNKFEKAKYKDSDVFTNLWKLTPLKNNPASPDVEPVEGGPIKLQLYNEDTHIMFDQFWLQAKKYVHPDSFQLAGSFEQIPDVATYPNMTMADGERKVGCNDPNYADNASEETTIVSHTKFDPERIGVELAWNPPPRCTEGQIESNDTMKCRKKDDIFFFTYTMGNTKLAKFYIGQNSFGFYVDDEYDKE